MFVNIDAPIPSLPQRATLNWNRTLDTLRQWSSRTLKYTRQLFQERIGQVIRTQDIELEQKIQVCLESNSLIENRNNKIFSFFDKRNIIMNIY